MSGELRPYVAKRRRIDDPAPPSPSASSDNDEEASFEPGCHGSQIAAMSWEPTRGAFLVTGGSDGVVRAWEPSGRHQFYSVKHRAPVLALCFTSDGSAIVSGGYDGLIRMNDGMTGRRLQDFCLQGTAMSLRAHPQHSFLFSVGTSSKGVLLFDTRSGKKVREMPLAVRIQDHLHLDNDAVVVASSNVERNAADRTLGVWDLESGALLSNQPFGDERAGVTGLCAHPSGNSFAAQTLHDFIAVFNAKAPYRELQKPKRRFALHTTGAEKIVCDISPRQGRWIASGSAQGDGVIYDYKTGFVATRITMRDDRLHKPWTLSITHVLFHPLDTGRVAVARKDGTIAVTAVRLPN